MLHLVYESKPRNIVTLETLSGRHRHTLAGALIGAAAIGVLGAVSWNNPPQQCLGSVDTDSCKLVFLAIGVLGGAGVGQR